MNDSLGLAPNNFSFLDFRVVRHTEGRVAGEASAADQIYERVFVLRHESQ